MHLADVGTSIMDKKTAEANHQSKFRLASPDRSFHSLMSAIEQSKIEVADLSAAALRGVLKGVITGEGPTTTGRAHFSRTLDPGDALLCARIMTAAGGEAGAPVTRLE